MSGGYYRPKGRRTFRVWFPWHGKVIFKNKYFDATPLYHEEQAKRVLEKIRAEVDEGIFDPAIWGSDRTLLFQNAWKIYQDQCRVGKDRMEARERIYNGLILPYFKNKSLKEIEEHHINDWWAGIPKNYAPSTLKVIRATLRAFLNFHRVTRVKMLEFPKIIIPKKAIKWLKFDEQEKVMEFIPTQHRPIINFLRTYGCRVSEAANLRKSDVDFLKGEIIFRERKNAKDNALAIMPQVEFFLRPIGKVTHLEYIFCTLNGLKYTRQGLYHIWEEANKKANQKYGTPIVSLKNGTRHSLACQLLNQGRSIPEVARILGNTPSVVERSYGAISVQRTEEILNVQTLCEDKKCKNEG